MPAMDEVLQNGATMVKQRDAAFTVATTPLQGSLMALVMSIPIGTRVLDLITGEEGMVIDGRRENVLIPIASKPGS
jgi:hypothetical protein